MFRGWISQGEYVERSEQILCSITGRAYAICVSSGTDALQLAIAALKLQHRVFSVPDLTFSAVHNAVVHANGTIRWVDADKRTWQADPHDLTKEGQAVIMAPCYGMTGSPAEVERLCRQKGMPMIEDAGESFGGSWYGRPCGSFGDVSCISFYANKIVTSGEGGACLTDDLDVARAIRLLANHGISGKDYWPRVHGANARMTDLQGALLYAQLTRMQEMVGIRRGIWRGYASIFGSYGPQPLGGEIPAPWLYAARVSDVQRDELSRRGLAVRPIFPPGSSNPIFEPHTHGHIWKGDSIAKRLHSEAVCFPISSAWSQDEIHLVLDTVTEVVRG